MKKLKNKLIVILGPTATGKTKLAVKLASIFNGEIVSADSRQVYKDMDIGTGKDLQDYKIVKNGKKITIPYHLIDVVSPNTRFSLAKYQKMAYKAIDDIIARGKTPFLAGGTGLYIKSVVDGLPLLAAKPDKKLRDTLESWSNEKIYKELEKLDPEMALGIDKKNKRRMIRYIEIMVQAKKPLSKLWALQKKEAKYNSLVLGITLERGLVNKKIEQRVDKRFNEGMAEEVARLHKEGVSWKRLESFGLEYKFIAKYLQGKLKYDEMVELLKTAIKQFSKRQITWFKKEKNINWIGGYGEAKEKIREFLRH